MASTALHMPDPMSSSVPLSVKITGQTADDPAMCRRIRLHSSRITAPSDEGFTLIELMVVLLILAILLAIAVPTFLGTSKSAKDRAAQQNLNTALVDSDTVFQTNGQSFALGTTTQYQSFATFMATSLAANEPSLAFVTTNSTSPSNISVSVSGGGNGIVLADRAPSGDCWYTIDNTRAISTTVNKAVKLRPYGTGTATATQTTSPKTGAASAAPIYLPVTAGNYYAEVSGDTTTADCSASNPIITGTAARYQLAQSSFPS
jgi:type IV pilus assembly protein PilA